MRTCRCASQPARLSRDDGFLVAVQPTSAARRPRLAFPNTELSAPATRLLRRRVCLTRTATLPPPSPSQVHLKPCEANGTTSALTPKFRRRRKPILREVPRDLGLGIHVSGHDRPHLGRRSGQPTPEPVFGNVTRTGRREASGGRCRLVVRHLLDRGEERLHDGEELTKGSALTKPLLVSFD